MAKSKKVEEKAAASKKPAATGKTDTNKSIQVQDSTKNDDLMPAEIRDDQIHFNQKHIELIKKQIAPDATDNELALFMMMARRSKLDPLLNQLYFIKYKNKYASKNNGCECAGKCKCGKAVYDVSYVTSIDGYRIIAHRTGQFAGIDLPEFNYNSKGQLIWCDVTVWRKDTDKPFAARVKFSEYNTGQNLWKSKPETMIAKVAESHALRKAFPQDLSGIYTTDEMADMKAQASEAEYVKEKITQPEPELEKIEESSQPEPHPEPEISESTKKTIRNLMIEKRIPLPRLKAFLQKAFEAESLSELTENQGLKTLKVVEKLPSKKPDEKVESAADVFDDDDLDDIDEGIEAMREQQEEITIEGVLE